MREQLWRGQFDGEWTRMCHAAGLDRTVDWAREEVVCRLRARRRIGEFPELFTSVGAAAATAAVDVSVE